MIRDLIALDNTSKVWIYQASRELTYDELDFARPIVHDFLDAWTSHNQNLLTYGNIFHQRFLAFFVDESLTGASGCSIDKSVHFVENLGVELNIDFFDRETFTYLQDDTVMEVHKNDMKKYYEESFINLDTLFFDNLVTTKHEFLKNWIKPLNNSWHKRFI
jgi:hypothetical protein